jgi:hypothetical protein
MDGHKHEGVSDEALEREIEAALGVDPSPEFLPRVRARIASERVHDGWAASWRWAGAVVALGAVAIVAAWTLRDPATAPREAHVRDSGFGTRGSGPEGRDPGLGTAAVKPEPSVPSAPIPVPAVRHLRAESRPAAARQLEVLIEPDEAAALKQLFTAISNRRIETRALPDLTSALKPPAPIEEIVLDPITISPLAALEGE